MPSLRSQSILRCVLSQIHCARGRFARIIHFSVQTNHIHMLVEADDSALLTQAMKGFAVRVARNVNGLLGIRGSVWADRYHARALVTPREVRNALVYVIRNRIKHGGGDVFDICSSASYLLDGWDETMGAPVARGSPDAWPVDLPESWLLKVGWKRLGLLQAHDVPAH